MISLILVLCATSATGELSCKTESYRAPPSKTMSECLLDAAKISEAAKNDDAQLIGAACKMTPSTPS